MAHITLLGYTCMFCCPFKAISSFKTKPLVCCMGYQNLELSEYRGVNTGFWEYKELIYFPRLPVLCLPVIFQTINKVLLAYADVVHEKFASTAAVIRL